MFRFRKTLLFILVSTLLSIPRMALSNETCDYITSDNACGNAQVGSLCDANGREGVCVPKSRIAGIISCVCVAKKPEKPRKIPKCKNGYRWSPVKNQCIKPMGQSPDGSVVCIPPYYWYEPDKNCEILFK